MSNIDAITADSQVTPDNNLLVTDGRTMREYRIPISNNAVQALDFRQITTSGKDAGLRLYDPGLDNTAVVESSVTLIDGKQGSIHFRDIPIDQLFHNNSFEEVIHLLIWGELPGSQQAATFSQKLATAANPPQLVKDIVKTFPAKSPPSTVIQSALSAWAASDPTIIPTQAAKNIYHGRPEVVDAAIISTISAGFTIIALLYCHQNNKEWTPAKQENSLVENFLLMCGHVDPETGNPKPEEVQYLNRLWILYADHEMTNSTASFLLVASTLADPLSCAVSAICSTYGPLHGGAIEMAYRAFQMIQKPEYVPKVIADVKSGKGRLYGFGHRVYKTIDPRVALVREVMDSMEKKDPLLSIAVEIDRVASADEYFTSRRLSPNADLYGCLVTSSLGFPIEIVTGILAAARFPGVLAHWREAMNKPPRLWRPQQIFVGKQQTNGNAK